MAAQRGNIDRIAFHLISACRQRLRDGPLNRSLLAAQRRRPHDFLQEGDLSLEIGVDRYGNGGDGVLGEGLGHASGFEASGKGGWRHPINNMVGVKSEPDPNLILRSRVSGVSRDEASGR